MLCLPASLRPCGDAPTSDLLARGGGPTAVPCGVLGGGPAGLLWRPPRRRTRGRPVATSVAAASQPSPLRRRRRHPTDPVHGGGPCVIMQPPHHSPRPRACPRNEDLGGCRYGTNKSWPLHPPQRLPRPRPRSQHCQATTASVAAGHGSNNLGYGVSRRATRPRPQLHPAATISRSHSNGDFRSSVRRLSRRDPCHDYG